MATFYFTGIAKLVLVNLIICAFMEYHVAAAMDLSLFAASEVEEYHARCLDGSPSGFYYEAGTNNSNNWIIFLQGGGLCFTEDSCRERAKSKLGSSHNWPSTHTGTGLLSSSVKDNPGFYTWNKVYVPYCSGDLYSGTRDVLNEWGLYFSGHYSILAIVDKLRRTASLDKALNLLLSGGSAGGIAAFEHVDYFASQFRHARVRASPQAGYFFPGNPQTYAEFVNHTPAVVPNSELHDLYNATVNEACADANAGKHYLCGPANIDYLIPYLQTPVYVAENQFDSEQIFTQKKCPRSHTQEVVDYVLYYGSMMRKAMQKVIDSPLGDGLYFPACLKHESNLMDVYNSRPINNHTYGESLADWFWGFNLEPHVLFENATTPQC